MNYEEKAKAYDKAVNKSIEFYNLCKKCGAKGTADFLEDIFPELKESEDERIREELIDAIHGLWDNDALPLPLSVKRKDAWIAWLEKQDKSANHLWKSADGDDLPEYDRTVIVLRQQYPLKQGEYSVTFAHRPNPKGWDGKSLTTGKDEHFTPKTYGKGGWSVPDVVWWIDLEFPK